MRSSLVARVCVVLIGLTFLPAGLQAAFAPRRFYDDFPFDRHWVAMVGPAYNEHLVRDVGDLNLALAVVMIAAAVSLTRPVVIAAALATLVYSVPHFAYHAANLQTVAAGDRAAELASLAVPILLGVVVLAVLPAASATTNPGGPSS